MADKKEVIEKDPVQDIKDYFLEKDGNMNGYQNQPYQATYMKGEVNFTVRGDDQAEVMKGLKEMIGDWSAWSGSQGEKSVQAPTGGVVNNQVVKKCPQCGSDMIFKSGIGKTGKPYQGNFCQNKECSFVEWK